MHKHFTEVPLKDLIHSALFSFNQVHPIWHFDLLGFHGRGADRDRRLNIHDISWLRSQFGFAFVFLIWDFNSLHREDAIVNFTEAIIQLPEAFPATVPTSK